MKTNVEKGLASHSSNMVAPQELASECEEGWTVVSSKRTLRKIRKLRKLRSNSTKSLKSTDYSSDEENQEPKISSANASVKSTSSGESWSSIVKRALKMDVPKVSLSIHSTPSTKSKESSNNEVQYIKTVTAKINEDAKKNSQVTSPPKVIMVPQDKENSSEHSFFHDEESMTTLSNHKHKEIISVHYSRTNAF